MEKKRWYESKVLWANLIGIVGVFIAQKTGHDLSPEIVASILGGINMLLRFITKKEIVWS